MISCAGARTATEPLARSATAGRLAAAVAFAGGPGGRPVHGAAAIVPAADLPAGARESDIDALAARAQRTFAVPGLATLMPAMAHLSPKAGVRSPRSGAAGSPTPCLASIEQLGCLHGGRSRHAGDEGSPTGRQGHRIIRLRLFDPFVRVNSPFGTPNLARPGLRVGACDLPAPDFTSDEIIPLRSFPHPATALAPLRLDNPLLAPAPPASRRRGQIKPCVRR